MWVLASIPFWLIATLFTVIAALCGWAAFAETPHAMGVKRECGGPGSVLLLGVFFMIAAGVLAVIAAKVAS